VNPRQLLLESFDAALRSVDPLRVVPPELPRPPAGRTLVVGAGKAAAAMARAVETHWPPGAPLEGRVITRYGHGLPTDRIRVVEAGHPLPDAAGVRAAEEILVAVRGLGPNDLLLALISGGGSSLLTVPAHGLELGAVRQTVQRLLNSGARIENINVVRKHLTATLGGRLALAAEPAPVHALIISDVTGDDPGDIASGPFAADPSTYADALDILLSHDGDWPQSILAHLQSGIRGEIPDTPKPGHPRFAKVHNRIVARGRDALRASAEVFAGHGITPIVLGDTISGEARSIGGEHAQLALQIRAGRASWQPPAALLSGGETTVRVRGSGKGGRNSEYLLSLAISLQGLQGVHGLAADTDGIDGTGDHAGAIVAPDTLMRAAKLGIDARQCLADNDSHAFFAGLGDLLKTGPTRTNVNDFRVVLID
jgi:hydroxypyruvate reductase